MKFRKQLIVLVAIFILIALILHFKMWFIEKLVFGYPIRAEGDIEKFLAHDGLTRSYLIHLPKNFDDSRSVPLVLILHGAAGNSEMARKTTGMNEVADKEGFIVVYPNGTGLFNLAFSWNAGGCCNYVEPLGVDDVGFLASVIKNIKKDYNIDPARIYVAGFSNGGMMAYRVACELTDEIAAIASVSSSMYIEECNPSRPISVIAFHGAKDEVIPYWGGESSGFFLKFFNLNHPSTSKTIMFWLEHNRCLLDAKITKKQDFVIENYSFCREDTEIVLYTMKKSGHVWPGGGKRWIFSDDPTEDLDTSNVVWNFFEKHVKN